MKKLFLLFLLFCFSNNFTNAQATEDSVRKFFNEYVNAANALQEDVFQKYYTTNPKIIRVVEKKDGTTQSVNVPLKTYLDEAAKGRKLARITRYKNDYTDIKISKEGDDFKVSANRLPSPGGKYPAYFIIGENESGQLKIKVESMNTPRQEFLK